MNLYSKLYEFALQQIAAESYLEAINLRVVEEVAEALVIGNNRNLVEPQRGYSRMTPVQADNFARRYVIGDATHHLANDTSGFSATLMFDTISNEYTLSIRSTEFRPQEAGGDRERDAFGAGLDIARNGFAFAQLASLERFYREIVKPVVAGSALNVTGYSLGGHLATVFTELHSAEINSTYVFNPAGRGGVHPGSSIERALEIYAAVVANPNAWTNFLRDIGGLATSSLLQRARMLHNAGRPLNPGNVHLDPRHQWAVTIAGQFTTAIVVASGKIADQADQRITRVFGHATSNDPEGVATLGILPRKNVVQVYIEDQPNFSGLGGLFSNWPGDFGNTHSIALLVDSLSLMSVVKDLDSSLSQQQIESMLAASSNQIATGGLSFDGKSGQAEANSLENALDAFRKLFVGPHAASTSFDSREGGFGNLQARTQFHQHLSEFKNQSAVYVGSAKVTPLTGKDSKELERMARDDIAFRYALRELNPFAVTGVDRIYADRNTQGELDVLSTITGKGQLSEEWLHQRATMLSLAIDRNLRDSGYALAPESDISYLYEDRSLGVKLVAFDPVTAKNVVAQRDQLPSAERESILERIYSIREQGGKGSRVVFGRDDNGDAIEVLEGRLGADHIQGGGGNDSLRGGLGNDVLEGGHGNDVLNAGVHAASLGISDNDTLAGGPGSDVLHGGFGTDRYYFYTGGGADEVFDAAEGPAAAKRQLGEIYFGNADGDVRIAGTFTALDADRKQFELELGGDTYFGAYQGDLATATPGKLFLFKGTDGTNVVTLNAFISGDFGIVLDPNAPQRTYSEKQGTDLPDNDFLIGVPHASSLSSDSPDQKVFGLGGADRIHAMHANAQAIGGAGNDYAFNGEGDQSLFGDGGRDVLVATAGEDHLEGGADDDALQGGADADFLDGGDGHDVLDGGAGADVIAGGEGNDFIFGGGSATVVIANWDAFADGSLDWGAVDASGDVLLRGLTGVSNVVGDGADVITAGAGRDWAFAGDGADAVSGGEGDDYLVGQAGNDSVSGDEGNDRLYGDGAQGDLVAGTDMFSVFTLPQVHGHDVLRGGTGADFLSGDGGADDLYGDEDDDILVGDSANVAEEFHGADYLDGGDGNDQLLGYGKGDALFGGAGNDVLGGDSSSIAASLHGEDYLDGEEGDDTLHGDGGADRLFGGAGNDLLDGDASNVAFEFHGADYLEGEEGNDALQGGVGPIPCTAGPATTASSATGRKARQPLATVRKDQV